MAVQWSKNPSLMGVDYKLRHQQSTISNLKEESKKSKSRKEGRSKATKNKTKHLTKKESETTQTTRNDTN